MACLDGAIAGLERMRERAAEGKCEFYTSDNNYSGRCNLDGTIVSNDYCSNKNKCNKYKERMGGLDNGKG